MTKGAANDASVVMDTGWTRSCSSLLQLRNIHLADEPQRIDKSPDVS